MPEAAITTANRGYTLVRKALNEAEVWDWFAEYLNLWTDVDQDIQDLWDQFNSGFTPVSITFDTTQSPTLTPEGTIWWNQAEYTLNIDTGLGATIQVGHEILLLYYNNTGSLIPNGTIIRPLAATVVGGEIVPTPELAIANSVLKAEGSLAVTTHDAANGTLVLATRFGRVRGVDTSSFSPGEGLWLSETVAGGFTNVKPSFPDFAISMGGALNSDAVDGEIFISITRDELDILKSFHDGAFLETVNFLISSNGTTVTGSLTNAGDSGRDLTMIFSDGMTLLDTTPAATVTLTPGTDTNPQLNYIYIPIATKVLTVSTSGWPSTEHIRVALTYIQSATTTQSDGGSLKNQNWNDHVKSESGNGHMLHLAYALREKVSATWKSGCEGNASVTTQGAAPDDVYVTVTAGYVMQLHDQTFDSFDTETGDVVLVPNDSTTPFRRVSNLNSELTDAAGVTMSGNTFSFILWGVGNKSGQPDYIMLNLPKDSYVVGGPLGISLSEAVNDVYNYAIYDIPNAFQGTGFLIARLTLSHDTADSGTWTLEDVEDLRGKIPNLSAGGAAGGTGVTTFLGLTDTGSTYSGDANKVVSVNSGETGLEFTEISTDATLEGNGISTALALAPSIPLDTDDAYEFTQNSIVGSTDTAAVGNRTKTQLDGILVSSNPGRYVAANEDYVVYVSITGANLALIDRHTGVQLKVVTPVTYGPIEFVDSSTIVIVTTSGHSYYSCPGLVLIQSSTSITPVPNDVGVGRSSGKVYYVDGGTAQDIERLNLDASYDTGGTLPSMINNICAFLLSDDEKTLYVIDTKTAAIPSAVWFRVYDISTITSPTLTGSVQLTTMVDGELYAKIGWHNGLMAVLYSKGGPNVNYMKVDLVDVSTPTAPTIASEDPGTGPAIYTHGRYIFEGVIYSIKSGTPDEIYRTQLPALTKVEPDFVDSRGGGGVYSADDYTDDAGNTIQWTKGDVGRAVRKSFPDVVRMSQTRADTDAPLVTGERVSFSQGSIVDSTDEMAAENRDATLLKTGDTIAAALIFGTSDSEYIWFIETSTGLLHKFDRRTLSLIDTATVSTTHKTCVSVGDRVFLFQDPTTLRVVDSFDLTYTDETISGITAPWTADYNGQNVYTVDALNYVYTLDIGDYSITSQLLASVTNRIWNMCVDTAGDYVFGWDADTVAGNYSIKKWDVSTGSLTATSSTFSAISGACYAANLSIVGDKLYFTNNGIVYILDTTSLNVLHTSSLLSDLQGNYITEYDSVLYVADYSAPNTTIKSVQLPALTQVEPDFVDSRGGGGVYSADGVTDDNDELYVITKQDLIRAVRAYIDRNPTTRYIDLADNSDSVNDWKLLPDDRNNIVCYTGQCTSVRLYVHDDVLNLSGFRTTVVIPVGSDNSVTPPPFFVYYYDGSTSTEVWAVQSEDTQEARDIAYDILVVNGEIIIVGQVDSDISP